MNISHLHNYLLIVDWLHSLREGILRDIVLVMELLSRVGVRPQQPPLDESRHKRYLLDDLINIFIAQQLVELTQVHFPSPLHIPIKVLPKGSADTVEGDRIGAAVGERQAEAHHTKNVPEVVVILLGCGAAVTEEHNPMGK